MAMRALEAHHEVVERAAELALDTARRRARRAGWRSSSASTTHGSTAEDLAARDPPDLLRRGVSHWRTGRRRLAGDAPSVRLYNPDIEADGWESRHTVVELVCDDRPFLVDSVTMALHRHGWGIHLRRPPGA